MKVVKTFETVRVVMKFGILGVAAVLTLTGVLPTNSVNAGFGII
ncbi:hypothetical protein ODS41_00240 [Pyrobaculum sp. 3827-6]|nr:hypothetical protein [Pyrobaculum sp. 3827-6]MCU7786362.1 hypothetical protein [Pyrobaculum sp. 3827-6]